MDFLSMLLIAVALSFDAMAVAAANGARHHNLSLIKALRIAFFFGFFQMFMPVIGWALGIGLEKVISRFDHWVAFLLLAILGVRMIMESFKKEEEEKTNVNSLRILILLSIATSIDALVVGMTFAILPVNIWLAVSIIGVTTFVLSLASIYIGKFFGERWGKKAEIIGGLILIGIGLKILIGHLF